MNLEQSKNFDVKFNIMGNFLFEYLTPAVWKELVGAGNISERVKIQEGLIWSATQESCAVSHFRAKDWLASLQRRTVYYGYYYLRLSLVLGRN